MLVNLFDAHFARLVAYDFVKPSHYDMNLFYVSSKLYDFNRELLYLGQGFIIQILELFPGSILLKILP